MSHIAGGTYRLAIGKAAESLELTGESELADARFGY